MPLFLCPYLCMWPFLGVLVSTCLCLCLKTFLKEKSGQYHHFREITNLCGRQASKFKLSSMFFIGGRKTKKSPLFGPGTKTNWWVVLHYREKRWYFWKWNTNKNCKTQALDIKWYDDQPRFKVNHCIQKKKLENTENDNRDKRENHWFGERTNATQIASQSDEPWPLSRHIYEHFSFVLGVFRLWAFVSGSRYLRALNPPQTPPPHPYLSSMSKFLKLEQRPKQHFFRTLSLQSCLIKLCYIWTTHI